MTTNQRVLMRLLTCLLGIVLSATSVDCAASPPSPGPSALRLGLHVPSTVTLYSPRYEGGSWESNFGVVLKQALQDELPAAFSKVESLPSFPPSGETPNLDAYIVVEQTVARFYGKAAMTAEAQATISVFNAAREPVKDLQVSTDYKATFSKDTQQARCDAAVRQVAHELVTELIAALTQPELHSQLERSVEAVRLKRERAAAPVPAAPAPTVFGRLVLATTPPGATVFLDEVYWGASNPEGKLTIAGVPAGPHVVRMTASGYKELKQSVTVVAGDNPVALKAEVAPPKPLREAEIEEALRWDVPKARIKALIQEFGVDFALTKAAEIRLLDAGADKDMLALIASSKK